ncbi:acyl-CoA:lysophosphatidylglycerol acyltransferase 1 isoform X1 [Tachysurus ichikawai]
MGWIQLGGPRIYGDVWPVVWNQEQRRCSQVDVSMNSGWGPDHMQDMAVWAVLDMKAVREVPMEMEALTDWLYQRFVEKEELLAHFYQTGVFPPSNGQSQAVSRAMTLDFAWLCAVQSFAFISGYMWYSVLQYVYCWFCSLLW